MIIIEIFTILFRLTGLPEDKARFQVISLLTQCGFTTSQSEPITMSQKRRQLAFIAILFGYTFSLIIVSTLINIFLDMSASDMNTFVGLSAIFTVVFIVIFILIKLKNANRMFDKFIDKLYMRLRKHHINPITVMDMLGSNIIANVYLSNPSDSIVNIPLKNSGIRKDFGIQILLIDRDGEILENIDGETYLLPNDNVIVLGKEKSILQFFGQKES
ncbi:TrkA C-terminal domain-containing protein [Desulfovibrio litoralis]|nr:TrkA C-terminal domain-containing protein [Desulfovibrio litoralis]